MSLDSCYSIADLRKRAKRRLPSPMFHYIDGGADDEWTLRRNSMAFDEYQLVPRCLVDVSSIHMSRRVLGCDLQLPFFLAPTGMNRLFHHDKELAAVRAAEKFGALYSLSTLATTSLEDVATAAPACNRMFQIYIHKDRELTREFVQRCKSAGYNALCLTVDTPVLGNREREKLYGLSMPPRVNRHNIFSYATSFHYMWNLLRQPDFRLANVVHRVDALNGGHMALFEYVNKQFDRSVTWADVAWLIEEWDGPFAIKGLSSVADAKRAVEVGASAVMLSNHGGRQLDFSPAPLDTLPAIRDAVGDALELIVDGGIRRGTDILKALALGADACSLGRPYLYGLAAAGQAGVEKALSLLRDELERDMSILGCPSLEALEREHVCRIVPPANQSIHAR